MLSFEYRQCSTNINYFHELQAVVETECLSEERFSAFAPQSSSVLRSICTENCCTIELLQLLYNYHETKGMKENHPIQLSMKLRNILRLYSFYVVSLKENSCSMSLPFAVYSSICNEYNSIHLQSNDVKLAYITNTGNFKIYRGESDICINKFKIELSCNCKCYHKNTG